ncbi:Mycosubtilin synthase subunit C [Includes: ATP-dependent serine adenylase (SerA) (Serine activase) [Durusdinium trenchii]|uniref:Mycosubtilin synthase subunit C n=1 Tax=Durusdinium trenchii TaxID=1381693 RepID=A0ABP0LQW5_9DINO
MDDGSGTTYTYQEVLKMSSSLAFALRQAGVFPDSLVPLMASRGVEMILGILGIIRSGSGYVPLDLHWPDDRLEDVLRQCGSQVLLASSDCHTKLSSIARRVSLVTTVMDVKSRVDGPTVADQGKGNTLAYTFFTSGTTGKPKGVMVENKGLVHRIHWFQQRWPLHPGEGIVSKVAYTFGLSEWEIFWPLTAGATLILAPPGGEKDAEYLLRRACNAFTPPSPQERLIPGKGPSPENVHYVAAHVFVPSMLHMVFDKYDELEEEDMQRKAGEHHADGTWWHHSKAREIVTCGEALNPSLAQKMFSRFHHCTLTNLYGPTEGEMTYWDVPQGRAVLRVSAGAPMHGSKVVLTDLRDHRLSAASLEPAEIAFGGPFIARGYLGRPDLDAKAFVPDFTASEPSEATDSTTLTGDLGRWREGGMIDLLGRKDFQVKLRGFRIELGEIEAACRAAGARAAVCVLRKSRNGTQGLVAYYEPGPDQEVPEPAVRASCQKSLPPYMQPQVIMRMEKLPRNSNGKIDRPKLPEPPTMTSPAASASPPETPVQKTTAATIAEILGLPVSAVHLDSDFQELGGNSLLMGRASTAIKKAFKLSNFKGTAMYQLGSVRRVLERLLRGLFGIAGAIESMLERKPKEVEESVVPHLVGSMVHLRDARLTRYYGRNALFVYLPIAAALDIVMMFSFVVLLKWLILGRVKPGKIELWSGEYYRWWFVNTLLKHSLDQALPLIADTSVANCLLRALGAKIGKGAKISVFALHDPDLLEVGAYATIGKRAKLATSSVLHGQVHLSYIRIGEGAAVGPTAVLSQDTVVPDRKAVVPLSTMPGWHGPVGSVAFHDAQPARASEQFHRRQNLLRIVFGLPAVLMAEVLPYYATYFVLVWTYDGLYDDNPLTAFTIWSVLLSWIYAHPMWFFRMVVVILQKWFLIGDFRKQKNDELSHWKEWKHWVHGRAVESHDFEELCELFTNTEFLSYIYRALGTKIGRRVQIDQLLLITMGIQRAVR